MKDQLHHHHIVYPQVRHWMMLARSRVATRSLRLRRRRAEVHTELGVSNESGKGDSGQRRRGATSRGPRVPLDLGEALGEDKLTWPRDGAGFFMVGARR
jgi:hypothetical protein